MHALMSARPASFDDPTPINDTDGTYLRQAIAWSRVARERGNRPFGAVVVADDGRVLAEAWCNTSETGDCTGHAETNAVRQLSPVVDRETLSRATLYSSAEPCVMCAGAIYWANIGRVVYGMTEHRLLELTGDASENPTMNLPCREVFARGQKPIEVIGPVAAMEEDIAALHRGFWRGAHGVGLTAPSFT